jgi:hypothetical protein
VAVAVVAVAVVAMGSGQNGAECCYCERGVAEPTYRAHLTRLERAQLFSRDSAQRCRLEIRWRNAAEIPSKASSE